MLFLWSCKYTTGFELTHTHKNLLHSGSWTGWHLKHKESSIDLSSCLLSKIKSKHPHALDQGNNKIRQFYIVGTNSDLQTLWLYQEPINSHTGKGWAAHWLQPTMGKAECFVLLTAVDLLVAYIYSFVIWENFLLFPGKTQILFCLLKYMPV